MSDEIEEDWGEWVAISTEGLTMEILAFVLAAKDMLRDSDLFQIHKQTGDIRVKEDAMRRIMAVNAMADELLELMRKRGDSENKDSTSA